MATVTQYDLERCDKETYRMREEHKALVKDLVQSELVYTTGVAIVLGVRAKTNLFHGTPKATHVFLITYSCVGFCDFLLAKILREYWVGTVFGILGAWMAAMLALTLPMHMALDITYHLLIVIRTLILTMVPLGSVAVLQANKMKARRAERLVIGVV